MKEERREFGILLGRDGELHVLEGEALEAAAGDDSLLMTGRYRPGRFPAGLLVLARTKLADRIEFLLARWREESEFQESDLRRRAERLVADGRMPSFDALVDAVREAVEKISEAKK